MDKRETVAAEVIREQNVCGLTLRSVYSGKEFRAFCDDDLAPPEVRRERCECKETAQAVIAALDAAESK